VKNVWEWKVVESFGKLLERFLDSSFFPLKNSRGKMNFPQLSKTFHSHTFLTLKEGKRKAKEER
jgi:hypothetical protein